MNLLALETSTRQPAAAIYRDGEWLQSTESGLTHGPGSARFPLQVHELLKAHSVFPKDLNAIAVSIGPGSFTGLRIGVVLAKTWAWATHCPLVTVDTLESIALGAVEKYSIPPGVRLHVVVDAHRDQFFRGLYFHSEIGVTKIREAEIIEISDLTMDLDAGDWITGPGLAKQEVQGQLKSNGLGNVAPISPDARLIGKIGWRKFREGLLTDPFELLPRYIRPSAAEEKSGPAKNVPT